MVAWDVTAAAPSAEKIRLRLIARLLTWRATSQRTLLLPALPTAAKFSWLMPSALLSPSACWSTPLAPAKSIARSGGGAGATAGGGRRGGAGRRATGGV